MKQILTSLTLWSTKFSIIYLMSGDGILVSQQQAVSQSN